MKQTFHILGIVFICVFLQHVNKVTAAENVAALNADVSPINAAGVALTISAGSDESNRPVDLYEADDAVPNGDPDAEQRVARTYGGYYGSPYYGGYYGGYGRHYGGYWPHHSYYYPRHRHYGGYYPYYGYRRYYKFYG